MKVLSIVLLINKLIGKGRRRSIFSDFGKLLFANLIIPYLQKENYSI